MPRYTCMQEITRRLYRTDWKTLQSCSAILADRQHEPPVLSWDHLELEVAVADRREVHSWPGASSFADEDEIRKILGNGPFASGDFAAFIGGIFGGSSTIQFTRQMVVNGRNLFEYSFQVKNSASRYEVDSAAGPVITGYEGSFLLDPQLEDLVHLTVRTEELPAKTAMCQAISDIEYGRTTIHDTNVLIPRQTNLRLVLADGEEAATVTSYSACRKFASTSVVLFEGISQDRAEAKGRSESEARQTPANPLPEGIVFECRIDTPIDSDTPAGTPIEGTLRSPIRDKNNIVLAPRGAHVFGRLLRVAKHFGAYDYFEVAVRLESVEVNGIKRLLFARLSQQDLGPLPPIAGYDARDLSKTIISATALLPDTGEFFFVQEHLGLHGVNAEWITTKKPLTPRAETSHQIALDRPSEIPAAKAATQNEERSAEAALSPNRDAPVPVPQPLPGHLPEFQLRVESNLVIVRAVVRNSEGKPIENLTKEDFRIFDRGKEQPIGQFEAVNIPPEPAAVGSSSPEGRIEKQSIAAGARRQTFLALYFDDLNTSEMDMVQARDAAESFLTELPRNERVGIFTSEGILADFTGNTKVLHDGLAKLHTSPRALKRIRECPDLSDYQAEQIADSENLTTDAWKAALDEAAHQCGILDPQALNSLLRGGNVANKPSPEIDAVLNSIRALARSIVAQVQVQTRQNLAMLEQVVNAMSHAPGDRTIVLLSTGFLSRSDQLQVNRIIDQALKNQIVISSLDPKGLALLLREADATRGYAPTASSGVVTSGHNLDFAREAGAIDVLGELADGTGGEFFHNNNDLGAGFDALAGSRSYYILAFVPQRFDGEFHRLDVKLMQSKGIVRARRGYYAVRNVPGSEEDESAQKTPEAGLANLMASREEFKQLSVDVSPDLIGSSGDARDVRLVIRLDLTSVSFRREGDQNVNSFTFATGVYDSDGKWVTGEEKKVDVKLSDSQLAEMKMNGVGIKNSFHLRPGKYLVREIVTDSEAHHVGAVNRTVEVP